MRWNRNQRQIKMLHAKRFIDNRKNQAQIFAYVSRGPQVDLNDIIITLHPFLNHNALIGFPKNGVTVPTSIMATNALMRNYLFNSILLCEHTKHWC